MRTQCPKCKSFFSTRDENKGKRARCRKCSNIFTIVCTEPPPRKQVVESEQHQANLRKTIIHQATVKSKPEGLDNETGEVGIPTATPLEPIPAAHPGQGHDIVNRPSTKVILVKYRYVIVALVLIVSAISITAYFWFTEEDWTKFRLVTKELSIGKVHEGMLSDSLVLSPDSKRVAYAAMRGQKWLAVVDGVEGKEYDAIAAETPVFGPRGRRVAYAARRVQKWIVVVDGVEGREYDAVDNDSLIFGFDGTKIAYRAARGKKQLAVVDGVEGKEYDGTGEKSLVFSPTGKRVAYAAMRGQKWLVVVDAVESNEYDELGMGGPVFSPNGKRVAYAALRGKK